MKIAMMMCMLGMSGCLGIVETQPTEVVPDSGKVVIIGTNDAGADSSHITVIDAGSDACFGAPPTCVQGSAQCFGHLILHCVHQCEGYDPDTTCANGCSTDDAGAPFCL